tara:strand:+ start:125 stop:469 length:345 start_codon:yes stop_codon:yes gene_type:complete
MATAIKKVAILGCDFDLDECADIATHGCIAGVPGFTYHVEILEAYDEYESIIMDTLDVWADELGADSAMEMIIDTLNRRSIHPDMDAVKEMAVWMYVEKLAYDFCLEEGHKDFV